MAIRESALPTAENLSSTDFIRCVTSDGVSRNVGVTDLTKTIAENTDVSSVNVASMVDGTLTDNNINYAIIQALEISKYIFIPDGSFTLDIEISDDCTMVLDKECYIFPPDDGPAIYAHDCSFNLIGGHILSGENDDTRTTANGSNPIIYLKDCHDSSITGVDSPHSKSNSAIWLRDCNNFVLEQCSFDNILRAAMFIWGHCTNVTVRNCRFEDSKPISGQDFCYFVYTGSMYFSDDFIPVDGLIYENNYCDGSEDCALDTHGARNVIIRNNVILNTVNAITAYNDNNRVTRPEGWVMENILIENNYVDSEKQIPEGSEYPHPCLFIGASGLTDGFDVYRNCIVRNNTFRTANDYENGALFLDNVIRNITIENNTIELLEGATKYIRFRRAFGFVFRNNRSIGAVKAKAYFMQAYGEVSGNIGFEEYDWSMSYLNYIKGLTHSFGELYSPPTVDVGDSYFVETGGLPSVSLSIGFGIRARDGYSESISVFSITVADGIATVSSNVYIPRLALSLTGDATVNAYIEDVIDSTHFKIVSSAGEAISDGSYTATIRSATTVSLAN